MPVLRSIALAAVTLVTGSLLACTTAAAQQVDPGFVVRTNVPGKAINCESGHFCVNINGRTYDYYRCGIYPVSGWVGPGYGWNHQTGNVWAAVLMQDRKTVWRWFPPNAQGYEDMTPVYFVQPC
ncbi:hypothetical protein OG474_02945 [Kribbella sp. NBC_01505]|uniref:hypothetical protein n=1 Tax=Kribbella sp. NBC_01505 TaxID=2903580 RepID=UPI0038700B1E